jgi:hypothetical protein
MWDRASVDAASVPAPAGGEHGRLRARPGSPLTAGMASTSGIRKRESCTWAPEILATSMATSLSQIAHPA